mgnify:CR=1 FL=1
MIREGEIVLFRFPQTDLQRGKLRPALIIRKLPSLYDDWLICMISTQLSQKLDNIDEVMDPEDDDFKESGLKSPSLCRVTRLAVINKSILEGSLGSISQERLTRIKRIISEWIKGS